ncbi:hypothetical protein LZC95_29180 [Pendulispora brunnea]|uniref:Uncharacterized protein n=1 Tax=Pendulispora brunnea TaxID=2905690 RepID=A0ABZ2JZK5_9BACT
MKLEKPPAVAIEPWDTAPTPSRVPVPKTTTPTVVSFDMADERGGGEVSELHEFHFGARPPKRVTWAAASFPGAY